MKYAAAFLVLVLAASSCAVALKDNSLSTEKQKEDVRLLLVDRARWSMSAHNMQPWEIALDKTDPRALRIFIAGDRLLPATDPFSRQIVMSIGGFISVLEDAAAAGGYSTRVDLFPEGEFPGDDIGASFALPVAEVRIEESSGVAASGHADAVSSATVKANLKAAAFSEAEERSYLELDAYDGVDLGFIRDESTAAVLKPILKSAFRLEMRNEPTLRESYELMRRNSRQINAQPWGLSYGSNFPEKSLGKIEFFETAFPMKMEKWGVKGADNFDAEVDKARVFLIVTTEGNGRLRQIQAGMLFQKLWLKAIRDGYAVVPASQPLQEYEAMAEYYREVHRVFASPGRTIQMIAFMGIPEEGYRRGFRISAGNLVRAQ